MKTAWRGSVGAALVIAVLGMLPAPVRAGAAQQARPQSVQTPPLSGR